MATSTTSRLGWTHSGLVDLVSVALPAQRPLTAAEVLCALDGRGDDPTARLAAGALDFDRLVILDQVASAHPVTGTLDVGPGEGVLGALADPSADVRCVVRWRGPADPSMLSAWMVGAGVPRALVEVSAVIVIHGEDGPACVALAASSWPVRGRTFLAPFGRPGGDGVLVLASAAWAPARRAGVAPDEIVGFLFVRPEPDDVLPGSGRLMAGLEEVRQLLMRCALLELLVSRLADGDSDPPE